MAATSATNINLPHHHPCNGHPCPNQSKFGWISMVNVQINNDLLTNIMSGNNL